MDEVVVPVSGGWDSAITWLTVCGMVGDGCNPFSDNSAVAVFTDPGREHPLTYAMLNTLDEMTRRPIIRLHGPTWEDALEANAWFLPWWKARWCTRTFKIQPFEIWARDREIVSYIGLRADEMTRTGYLGDKGTHIKPRYPLQEMGITWDDRNRIAKQLGLPPSGPWSCDCCPFRNHYLWVEMIEEFPERAEWCAWVEEEKIRRGAGGYGWMQNYKVRELIESPIIRAQIRRNYWRDHQHPSQLGLWEDTDEEITPCLMCQVK